MSSRGTRLYALDYGSVFKREGDGWVEEPEAHVDATWLEELRRAGFTPRTDVSEKPAPSADSELRVVPLGLHPQIVWSGDAVEDAAADLHETIRVPPRGDPHEMGPGAVPGGLPPWVGKVVVWGGKKLVWNGFKWILKELIRHPDVP